MKHAIALSILLIIALFSLSLPAHAQDSADETPTPIADFYEFEGLSIGYLPEITGEPTGELMEASIGRMTEWPAGRTIQFSDYTLERLGGLGAQVMVFPVADYRAIDAFYDERMDELQGMVDGLTPLQLNMEVPRLPAFPSANPLVTHLHPLELTNAYGVRYITMSVQNTVPPSRQLEYVFIGFTEDNTSLIYATFPVDAGWLPTSMAAAESGQFDALMQLLAENEQMSFATYEAYMLGAAYVFNNAPADSFTPGLAMLDAVIATLTIDAE